MEYNNAPDAGITQLLPRIDWNIRFFGAHKQTVSAGWSIPKEFHHAFEILIVLDGAQETVLENGSFLLRKGDILLIPPGFEHTNTCISAGPMTYFCAHFDIDEPSLRMKIMKNTDWVYEPSHPYHSSLNECLERWIRLLEEPEMSFTKAKLRAQVVLFELLEVLLDIQPADKQAPNHASITAAKYAKEIADAIKRAFKKHAIAENAGQPEYTLHIQPIISSLGISPNYGLEVFQKVYHMSPRTYLSNLKLQEAKMLMQQPNISLHEISNRLGYKNLSHFSRQFKRWTDLSPSEFRRSQTMT
ncbi:AraC family transcriptional regulator [Paenibacillus piscarius]|uniref:AraC family transcriptional regulator n=1 Tax=Paenibacillus piscarius TaxID=1089681 RepID=UPI001EE85CCB|nr:AraC family transcriptional regulator [Paenibacillus piscarius]